ncbi:MAG: helix-turn-helix transcriptional regulator [Firmicutes bacterium]|nr:helix-turn-helix transcriptional regulator [Bacillota bacterium]
MQELIELIYIFIIIIGAMAFAMQAMSERKKLDSTNQMVKSNNMTIFMALILLFNICDFLIIFFEGIIGKDGISWFLIIENVLEVAMAYALIAMLRDVAKERTVRWLPVFFVAVAVVILWTDTLYTIEAIEMSEFVYAMLMIVLNAMPVFITIGFAIRYIRILFGSPLNKMARFSVLLHSILFVVLCVITTINTIDLRTTWDFVKDDEKIYTVVWLIFNVYNVVFVWTSCKNSNEEETVIPETIDEKLEKIAEQFALSGREEEIARLIYNGYNNNDIADELCLSINTVKVHTSNLYKKIGVTSRLQAVQLIRDDIKR